MVKSKTTSPKKQAQAKQKQKAWTQHTTTKRKKEKLYKKKVECTYWRVYYCWGWTIVADIYPLLEGTNLIWS